MRLKPCLQGSRGANFTRNSQRPVEPRRMSNTKAATELVEGARAQIEPLFLEAIDVLNEHQNFLPMAFFSELLIQLRQIDREVDLLHLFFELSTTAFQGFVFSSQEAASVDALLARCEMISLTLSAGVGEDSH